MAQLPHFSGVETEIQRGKGTDIIQGRTGKRIMSSHSLLIALCVCELFSLWIGVTMLHCVLKLPQRKIYSCFASSKLCQEQTQDG